MSNEVKIEKGIKIPTARMRSEHWPIADMGVGDSFLVPASSVANVRRLASNYQLRLKTKYTVRKVEGGYRCWRIA